jgi:hypothetical protein
LYLIAPLNINPRVATPLPLTFRFVRYPKLNVQLEFAVEFLLW